MRPSPFQHFIRSWYRARGRHALPWRRTHSPYKIFVSEVMLQQTQVSRVIPKYREFLLRFPNVGALDRAPLKAVLSIWQGMGYNRRALYLKRAAQIIANEYGSRIPRRQEVLVQLPGIGPGTAGAIAAFAFGERVAFLETNIRRLYLHFFFPRQRRVPDQAVLAKIRATLPHRNIREWYYALMDYGAIALKRIENPNRRSAHYVRQGPFKGSRRELRGKILHAVVQQGTLATGTLHTHLKLDHRFASRFQPAHFRSALHQLIREGLIETRHGYLAPARGTRAQ